MPVVKVVEMLDDKQVHTPGEKVLEAGALSKGPDRPSTDPDGTKCGFSS